MKKILSVIILITAALIIAPVIRAKMTLSSDDAYYVSAASGASGNAAVVARCDYLLGIIACHNGCSDEALRALAIAANTYISNASQGGALNNQPPCWMSVQDMQEQWGDSFASQYIRLSKIVNEIKDTHLLSDGKTADIDALFDPRDAFCENRTHGDILAHFYPGTSIGTPDK